jgi:acetamidase/formamidase
MVRRFGKEQTTLLLDPDAEPIAVLKDGERVVIRTEDSVCGLAKARAPGGMHIDEVLETLGGACPLTGPFAVEGATRGDVLEVEIHRVDPVPGTSAWTGVFGGFGALSTEQYGIQEDIESNLSLVDLGDGVARLETSRGPREIPIRPFLGTIGVAPRWERRLTFSQSPEYLGDVDQPDTGAGATLVLPVNVDGGLLSIGDAHAAQGDGEITGTGIEIEAEVELTVRVRQGDEAGYVSLPQINTDEWIGSVAGMHGVNLGDCARAAYTDLVHRLVRTYGYTQLDAYRVLGQVGRLRVGNMIDPFYSVLATVERVFL